jgi:hypothetical protein
MLPCALDNKRIILEQRKLASCSEFSIRVALKKEAYILLLTIGDGYVTKVKLKCGCNGEPSLKINSAKMGREITTGQRNEK